MKQLSQSMISLTNSRLGRWTKFTAMGCMLALVFLVTAGAQPQSSKQARPFKVTGIVVSNSGTAMELVGAATHLGNFVSHVSWEVNVDGSLYVHVEFTAANGDTLQAEVQNWVGVSGVANILGGTGRFAGASGSYVGTFSGANLAIFTADGTISY